MSTYKYAPLSSNDTVTRLLVLYPGKFDDPLTGHLEEKHIYAQDKGDVGSGLSDFLSRILRVGKRSAPFFEALSYTWGSQLDPGRIILFDAGEVDWPYMLVPEPDTSFGRQQDDSPFVFTRANEGDPQESASPGRATQAVGLGYLLIGRNLESALRHLRHPDEPRWLWTDSICINQIDLDEKAAQVQRMSDIYREAYTVIVWLGPEAEDSGAAMKVLASLAEDCSYTEDGVPALGIQESPDADIQAVQHPFTHDEWLAVSKLLQRSWFTRLWVQQEIGLAESAILVTGHEEMPWSTFATSLILIHGYLLSHRSLLDWGPEKTTAFREQILGIGNMTKMSSVHGILDIIHLTRKCCCVDDRDRVYGVLGLLDEEDRGLIQVDYTKDTKEVYKSLFVALFHQGIGRSLGFLRFCRLATSPTWVPDLHTLGDHRNPTLQAYNHATADLAGMLVPTETGSAEVVAVCIGVLSTCKHIPEAGSDACFVRSLVEVMTSPAFLGPNPDSWKEEELVLFTKAITAGHHAENSDFPEALPLTYCVSLLREWALNGLSNQKEICDINEGLLLSSLQTTLLGLACLKTEEGVYGIGPAMCEPGDMVYAVFGCNSPMILRSAGAGPEGVAKYIVVGPSYFSEYADGQAVLGDLPSGWSVVHQTQKHGAILQRFLHGGDGRVQDGDPRLLLAPLPAAWTESQLDGRSVFSGPYEGDNIEETYDDPRRSYTTSIYLGFKVETILLV